MSEYINFKKDIWLAPFELTSGANTMDFETGGAPDDFDFPTNRTWYMTYNGVINAVDPASAFLGYLEAALASTFSTTCVVSAQEDEVGEERIRIYIDLPSEWTIKATSTFPLDILGFETGSDIVSVNQTIYAPYSFKYSWHSNNMFEGGALEKNLYTIKDLGYSSERVWEASVVNWGTNNIRQFRYDYLPSARVWEKRSNDTNRANLASCAIGDPNVTLMDIWNHLVSGYQTYPVYVIHDYEKETGLSFFSNSWEAIDLYERWDNYSDKFGDQGIAGDYWTFNLMVRVRSGNYNF